MPYPRLAAVLRCTGMIASRSPGFAQLFDSRRRSLERARATRAATSGFCFGLVFGTLGCAVLHAFGASEWRLAAGIGCAAIGALSGALLARRRRLSREHAALFFDARLENHNEVSAALAPLLGQREPSELEELLQQHASDQLLRVDARRLRPKRFSRLHGSGIAAGSAFGWLCSLAPALPVAHPPPVDAQTLQAHNWVDVATFERLQQLSGQDPSQARRLKDLSAGAEQLKEDLAKGLPPERALSEISRLQDAVSAELGELGNAENRSGLAAAVNALRSEPLTGRAARAFAVNDLVEFDREMKRLAASEEEAARAAAKKALLRAEQAAQQEKASAVQKELASQLAQLDARSQDAAILRRLAAALNDGTTPEPAASNSRGVTEREPSLADALQMLSRADTKRLADKLKQGLESGRFDFEPETRQELERLAESIAEPNVHEQLKGKFSSLTDPGAGAVRQQALADALRALAQTQQRAGRGATDRALAASSEGKPGAPDPKVSPSTPSPGLGGQVGEHGKGTRKVETEIVLSRSEPSLDLTRPLPDSTQGRAAGRSGEAARRAASAPPATNGGSELQGVERTPIPAEYREQVSRYFSPE